MVLLVVMVSGCTSSNNLDFSGLKDPNLNYSWEFSDTVSGGGHTLNSTYFQLKRYNIFEILFNDCNPPYQINYKHEEGHIYINQMLKIENYDDFEYSMFNSSNLNISYDPTFRQFNIAVSEGIADYYAISYFNNSTSDEYFKCIEKRKDDSEHGFKQHYQGFLFVQYALNNKLYYNLTDMILDLDSVRQYNYFSDFIRTS